MRRRRACGLRELPAPDCTERPTWSEAIRQTLRREPNGERHASHSAGPLHSTRSLPATLTISTRLPEGRYSGVLRTNVVVETVSQLSTCLGFRSLLSAFRSVAANLMHSGRRPVPQRGRCSSDDQEQQQIPRAHRSQPPSDSWVTLKKMRPRYGEPTRTAEKPPSLATRSTSVHQPFLAT